MTTLSIYLSMVETEEDSQKVLYIYNNFYKYMAYSASEVLKNNSQYVQDIVHTAMIAIIENIDLVDLSDNRKAKNLCCMVARNKAIDFCRSKDNQVILLNDDSNDISTEEGNPIDIVINRDTYDIVLKTINLMDEKYRNICHLKYVCELKEREIALLTGMSPKTVGTRIFRGKQILKEALKKENIYV